MVRFIFFPLEICAFEGLLGKSLPTPATKILSLFLLLTLQLGKLKTVVWKVPFYMQCEAGCRLAFKDGPWVNLDFQDSCLMASANHPSVTGVRLPSRPDLQMTSAPADIWLQSHVRSQVRTLPGRNKATHGTMRNNRTFQATQFWDCLFCSDRQQNK